MQEYTHRKQSSPPPPTEHWPGDEELAAYIDGTLGKAESRRVKEHLADCEECFAVYMETLQFQLDSKPEEGNVVAFPSKKDVRSPWWYRIAALLVVGVGIGGAYYALLAPPPALPTAVVVAQLRGNPELTESVWRGPVTRGGPEEEEEIPVDPASFRMGVQLVNLQLGLEANQARPSEDAVAAIINIVRSQIGLGDLEKDYTSLTGAIENQTPPASLAGKAARLAEESQDLFDAPHLNLGQWVEAGRLAAIAGQPAFFERSDTRTFLRRLLWRQKLGLGDMKLDPAARRSLADISSVLEKRSLDRADYGKLSQDLRTILNIYYPES